MKPTTYVIRSAEQPGFVTTDSAYRDFVQAARLRPLIATQLRRLRQGADLLAVGACIRTAYFEAEVPAEIAEAIEAAYLQLGGPDNGVVVGGLTAGDVLDEFLTGPQEIFCGVKSQRALLAAVKRCWGSLFTDRAIIYREVRDIDHLCATVTVSIEPMVALSTDRHRDPVLQGASAG